jgi:lysophospholipase
MTIRDSGYFSAQDETRLYWLSSFPSGPVKGVVAIVHGYGDHIGRYAHTIEALNAHGFAAIGFDYRGHGQAAGQRGDVVKWTDYLDDLSAFWLQVKARAQALPVFMLAHSHGGLMATHWAASPANAGALRGLILTNPYYDLAFKPPALKLLAARAIRNILPQLSLGNELQYEQLSRDEAWQASTKADPLYGRKTTPRFYFEHTEWQSRLGETSAALTLPVLMVLGEVDPIASTVAGRRHFDTLASSDKTLKVFPDMRHEVLNELDRASVETFIVEWILKRL